MWHVTLTVGGVTTDVGEVCSALGGEPAEQPFLLAARYSTDQVQLDYWEEAHGCEDAAALALRLWGEHRASAGLPLWQVLGLEVVEREAFERRERGGVSTAAFVPDGVLPGMRLRALPPN
jgi:hypothetical protein